MSLREFYTLQHEDSQAGSVARELLSQQHWYSSIAEFDPRTGDALALPIEEVMKRVGRSESVPGARDRLWRIVEHSRSSVERIMDALSESPRREQAMLPIRDVKELNATSFVALSRRPGRNIREKLAGRPYMQAVRRYQSVDLPQNRLFKAYLVRVSESLELRQDHLGIEDDLGGDISRWLRGDEAVSIGTWENLAPNNTMLSHTDYRRVWNSWRWLQDLDEAIARDLSRFGDRAATVERWVDLGRRYAKGLELVGAMPVVFDYETFAIDPWMEPVLLPCSGLDRRDPDVVRGDAPICVDLTAVRPWCATGFEDPALVMNESFIWQRWTRNGDATDLQLFDADLVLLHSDATSIGVGDLFDHGTLDEGDLNRAAHAFARRLRARTSSRTLLWLVPDLVNDFQVNVLRRNLNSQFPSAEPIPRSVAAVFEQVGHDEISGDGFSVLVVDSHDGVFFGTRLMARHDPELEARVPETYGYIWERTPHLKIQGEMARRPRFEGARLVDLDGIFHDAGTGERVGIGLDDLPQDLTSVAPHDLCVVVVDSPVRGGMRLHQLQTKADDLPLWRDHIPELSIKVIGGDGRRVTLPLVSKNTSIRPMRGVAVQIPVKDPLALPAGQPYYEFPLFQMGSASSLGYEAFLRSPHFPLPSNTVCRLHLTYTYGADDPYTLRFVPEGGSIPAVTAEWRPMTGSSSVELNSLPIPPFPEPKTWEELQHFPRSKPDKRTGSMERDLLDWIANSFRTLEPKRLRDPSALVTDDDVERWVRDESAKRVIGSFKSGRTDKRGEYFCFVDVDGEEVFCHSRSFLRPVIDGELKTDDMVSLSIDRSGDRPQGRYVSYGTNLDTIEQYLRRMAESQREGQKIGPMYAEKGLFNSRFPTYEVWRHGRSIRDPNCPEHFRQKVIRGMDHALSIWNDKTMPISLRNEVFFFLCRLHADAPVQVGEELVRYVKESQRNPEMDAAVAYSIAACTENWQQHLFDSVVAGGFCDDIWMLSVVFWRSPEPVSRLSAPQASRLLSPLRQRLEARPIGKQVARALEVLLALLRTRESGDAALNALLSPRDGQGRALVEQIDQVTDEVVARRLSLTTRIEFDVEKPSEFRRIPDLLYVTRLFLTGDDGARAVRITGVRDQSE